jgi:hypothetical protein
MQNDNLTAKIKEELGKRGVAVNENNMQQALQLYASQVAPRSFAPQTQEEPQKSNSSILNAVGVGLWSALDTAAFSIPGAFIEEEKYLDFEDPLAKYTGAIGGLAGFIAGAPIKMGAKAVSFLARPAIKKIAAESGGMIASKTIGQVVKGMSKRGVAEGLDKKIIKEVTGKYKTLAHQSQTKASFAETFGEKATGILRHYTDDAVTAGKITKKEADAIYKMFGDNYTKRPLQDFIGVMAERGLAKTNPILSRVIGHAINDSLMFGMIDTVFEGISTIEDGHFDWTAPLWGVATGAAFAQISWLQPVGKGNKWFPDFKAGIRAAFGAKSPYGGFKKEQLAATAKFFGESLGKGRQMAKFEYNGIKDQFSLMENNLFLKLEDRFGSEGARVALVNYLDSQKKKFGKEMLSWATKEGAVNVAQNWKRMALGGVLFNFHTLADMFIHEYEPGIHDVLPHFLIGAFLQHGKNPARLDFNSSKMNQLRSNLHFLGFDVRQLTHVPSFAHTKSPFSKPFGAKEVKHLAGTAEEMGFTSNTQEMTTTPLAQGEISIATKGNPKFEVLYNKLKGEQKYLKSLDDISTKEAERFVAEFDKATGLKTLEEYNRYFDEQAYEGTKELERRFPEVLEEIRNIDTENELAIEAIEKSENERTWVGPETISVSNEIKEAARAGKLEFLKNTNGEVLKGEEAVEQLINTLDGYGNITFISGVMGSWKQNPSGERVGYIKSNKTIEGIYKTIRGAERRIDDLFPNNLSYSDSFTFKGSEADYAQVITQNIAIRSAKGIYKIFSPEGRDGKIIERMRDAGLLVGDVSEPLLRTSIENIEIKLNENSGLEGEAATKKIGGLKRALYRIQQMQAVAGGYNRVQDAPNAKVTITQDKIESLLSHLKENQGLDIQEIPSWLHEKTMNFILRDKIQGASITETEITSIFDLSEYGLAHIGMQLRGGKEGFQISLMDEAFIPASRKSEVMKYNSFVRQLVTKSNGLIQYGDKVKAISNDIVDAAISKMPVEDSISARGKLIEFVNVITQIGDGKGGHAIGQFISEGGASKLESWLIQAKVLEYDRKSNSKWSINIKNFNEEVRMRIEHRINEHGFTPEYIESVYTKEAQIAREAFERSYRQEYEPSFSWGNFLEKYNIDTLDYAPETKEAKKAIYEDIMYSNADIKSPRYKLAEQLLDRISVKVGGEWIEYNKLGNDIKGEHKKEIINDFLKIVVSQDGSRRINILKYNEGRIVESEGYQQEDLLYSKLKEMDLPWVLVEKEAVVYDEYNGRVFRRFIDVFGDTTDLPQYERETIQHHRGQLNKALNTKAESFGVEHKNGMMVMQISKDTAPIAIAKEQLFKIDKPFLNIAKSIVKDARIDKSVRDRISEVIERIELRGQKNIAEDKIVSESDSEYALRLTVLADMFTGRTGKGNRGNVSGIGSKLVEFLNGEKIDKSLGRIKLYNSKNGIRSHRQLLHSLGEVYGRALGDAESERVLNRFMRKNGLGVAIWNDEGYSTVRRETERIIKAEGIEGWEWDNIQGTAHDGVSSFDSIGYVSKDTMRLMHILQGHNPNSTNPVKPMIASNGRSGGALLMGKTLLIYSPELESFFQTNSGANRSSSVDILLAGSAAKAFNKGKVVEGADDSLINQPYSRITTSTPIGEQKIRHIPLEALAIKPEADKSFKAATLSNSDYNYMNSKESGLMFVGEYEKDLKRSIEDMSVIMGDPIRTRTFMMEALGSDGVGSNPETGGMKSLNNMLYFATLSPDANLMSYSSTQIKNKLYNLYIGGVINGRKSVASTENGDKVRYGGQAPIIQVAHENYRLAPTLVNKDSKMLRRGEIMINNADRNVNISEMIKSKRDVIFVDGEKTFSGKDIFGEKVWNEIISTNINLDNLFDMLAYEKSTNKELGKNLQIGIMLNRKPRTRPNDLAILGLKGFLPKEYGRAALVNSLDVVNIFEGDYDADKIDYFYGARKEMHQHAVKMQNIFPQGIDPSYLQKKSSFSWANDVTSVNRKINEMAANSTLSKKAIGTVQKVPRMLNYLKMLSTEIDVDGKKRNLLFETVGENGVKDGSYIAIDYEDTAFFLRQALEAQYMIDMQGGTNSDLMKNVRDWKGSFLFPEFSESITPREVNRRKIGFINDNIAKKTPSKRIRIFRKFNKNGDEIHNLSSLEKDMIKTMMDEYGRFLNVAGDKTFERSGENRSITYDDVFTASDNFFQFNKNLSNSLYYKLRYKRDLNEQRYGGQKEFDNMFGNVEGKPIIDYSIKINNKYKEIRTYRSKRNIFSNNSEGVNSNAINISRGKAGGMLERSLHGFWESDIFDNNGKKKFHENVVGDQIGYMDKWYQQLRSGEISDYSGSVDRLQENILSTILDSKDGYNKAAYIITSLKRQIAKTMNQKDLSYKHKENIINKLNKSIKATEARIIELMPEKYKETFKGKDLTRFTFESVEPGESQRGVIEYSTVNSLIETVDLQATPGVNTAVAELKEIRQLFYGNNSDLGKIRKYGGKTTYTRNVLDYLAGKPDLTTFYEIETDLLARGFNDYGAPFILEFMRSARNDYSIGIKNGQLVSMPYQANQRYSGGLKFLSDFANQKMFDDGRSQSRGSIAKEAEQVLKILIATEINFDRFFKGKYDMRNFGDANFSVDLGDGLKFSLANVRLPGFGEKLESVVGDFASIKWGRESNRISKDFNLMNDNVLSFYNDIMQIRYGESGIPKEFQRYMNTMNDLRSQMLKNEIMNPLEYMAIRQTLDKNLKSVVQEVISGGMLQDGTKNASIQRILNNPVFLLTGSGRDIGAVGGMSFETKVSYNKNKLKQAMRVLNELKESGNSENLGYDVTKAEGKIDKLLKDCGG